MPDALRRYWRLVSLLTILLAFAACADSERTTLVRAAGGSMGTSWSVQAVAPGLDAERMQSLAQTSLDEVEERMSTWIDESELSRLSASTSTEAQAVSAPLCEVLDVALVISRRSQGAFDVTVYPLVTLWGFGTGDLADRRVPERAEITETLSRTGFDKLDIDCSAGQVTKRIPDLTIDLSAIAKGYGVDRVAAALEQFGIGDYLVEVGGEMRVAGRKPDGSRWRIGIETPNREVRQVYEAIEIADMALATSGDYRNFFEADGRVYSHTIDPRTGSPTTHSTAGVTVLHESATYADAWATALLVLGSSDGLELAERENIAALFLDRSADGIDAKATSLFGELTSRAGDEKQ